MKLPRTRFLTNSRRLLLCFGTVVFEQLSGAYSILTHQQIVDVLWIDCTPPLVKTVAAEF